MRERITVNDIAMKLGMSRATVSSVLGDKVYCCASEKTKKLVREAAREMGYTPNFLARDLKSGRTRIIGLVSDSMQNEVSSREMVTLSNLLVERGYHVFVSYSKGESELRWNICQDLVARGCEALVVSIAGDAREQELPALPAPVILIRRYFDVAWEHQIVYDYSSGMESMFGHLKELGHRNIYFFGKKSGQNKSRDQRYTVFSNLLEESRIMEFPALRDITTESVRGFFREYPDCTAVICFNDLIAMRLIQSCAELGVQVPRDLSVVGFDDIGAAEFFVPSLSTVHHPGVTGATEAFQLLMNLLEGEKNPVKTMIKTEYIKRKSVDKPRTKTFKI